MIRVEVVGTIGNLLPKSAKRVESKKNIKKINMFEDKY
jgi:hypothetical protein